MNKRLISLMAAALALLSAGGQVTFTGAIGHTPIVLTPDANTGLNKIYVLYDTEGVGMSYTGPMSGPATWTCFDQHNWGNPDTVLVGYETTLDQVIPNMGYKIEVGSESPFYCWVVNYADYPMELFDMSYVEDNPCTMIRFMVDGTAPKIPYSTITGHTRYLDREIELSYNTLEWTNDSIWEEESVVETFESLEQEIAIEPPLCNTAYKLTGDRFLEQWGEPQCLDDPNYYIKTQAVGCGANVYLVDNHGEKKKLEGPLTGGSAPVHLQLVGSPTDAVVYRKWEIATDPEFEEVLVQYNEDEVDYTLNDAGTYYLRYMVANAAGSCEAYSDNFQITVSESQLGIGPRGDLPNVFAPGSTEGVWKVSYKSLVEFHCWIFNRWGNLVFEFTDPDLGWDGTYHGKQVDTGVYYYVVTATGSDGVKYKKRGDITVLHYKRGGTGTTNPETGGLK